MKPHANQQTHRQGGNLHRFRHGISLLEVLISLGLLSIGLLGVIALIPVAAQQAEEGARNDTMSNFGRRAFREFAVRGFLDPVTHVTAPQLASSSSLSELKSLVGNAWVEFPLPNAPPIVFSSSYIPIRANAVTRNSLGFTGNTVSPTAVCIDPLGHFLPDATGNQTVRPTFPHTPQTPGGAWMPRLTLASTLGLDANQMLAQSEMVTRISDDLEFNISDSTRDPLIQQSLAVSDPQQGGSNSPSTAVVRYAEGRYSWFATLVPGLAGEVYRLSVAIVDQRNRFEPEDVRPVDLTQSTIVDGVGELTLTGLPIDGLKKGNWIMLMSGSGFGSIQPVINVVPDVPQYAWFRVTAVSGNQLSIEGTDWTGPGNLPISAVVVPNVVAVHSKTVRISEVD